MKAYLHSLIGSSFYEDAFKKALGEIWFPNFNDLAFSTAYEGNLLSIKTSILVPDSKYLPEINNILVYHLSSVDLKKIPKDMVGATRFFHNLIFRIYMELHTHEMMEMFLVRGMVYRHPHQGYNKLKYEGSKMIDSASTHGSSLWRNHVMWEAVALVAKDTPPDFRSKFSRMMDNLVDWDIRVSLNMVARVQLVPLHLDSLRNCFLAGSKFLIRERYYKLFLIFCLKTIKRLFLILLGMNWQ